MAAPAILALSDGTLFRGTAIGDTGQTVGEVVFNTAMTGYQEILSDPSYANQLVTLTYPHIGNVGCNSDDDESPQVWAAGLIIRDSSLTTSNWRSQQSLQQYLVSHQIVAIADIDTRHLTQIIRDKGAQSACIATNGLDDDSAIQLAQGFSGLENLDLAKVVTTEQSYTWREQSWQLTAGYEARPSEALPYKVVVYDYGVKRNILRLLVDRGCDLTVVPAMTPVEDVLALKPDGVFLSNGPGDPAPCDYAISAISALLEQRMPLFGICLGHQLLALAAGAKTIKMKFGHHGANHPVEDIVSKQVFITSQNHGFMVDELTLPSHLEITHRSLFDGSVQGLRFKDRPALSFQGHPEASPGPHDLLPLFDKFIQMMQDPEQLVETQTTMMANEG